MHRSASTPNVENQHICLLLLFSPNLTWRDIMYITVLGSRPFAIPSNTDLVNNAGGFNGTLMTSSPPPSDHFVSRSSE